jgi:hypothetical protein
VDADQAGDRGAPGAAGRESELRQVGARVLDRVDYLPTLARLDQEVIQGHLSRPLKYFGTRSVPGDPRLSAVRVRPCRTGRNGQS